MEDQYKTPCYHCCRTLGENVSIMCWVSKSGKTERTYCNQCYWSTSAYKHDANDDNADENPLVLKNIKVKVECVICNTQTSNELDYDYDDDTGFHCCQKTDCLRQFYRG